MKTRSAGTGRMPARLTTMLLALLIGIGTVGAAGIADAQATEQFAASRTAAASTRGFWIDNLSTKKLKLTGRRDLNTSGWDNKELLPVGYVILPGEISHSELDSGGYVNHVVYDFDVLDPDGSVHSRIFIGMVLDAFGIRFQAATANTLVKPGAQPVVSIGSSDDSWALSQLGVTEPESGQDISIYDPQGTTFDGTALTPPQQGG